MKNIELLELVQKDPEAVKRIAEEGLTKIYEKMECELKKLRTEYDKLKKRYDKLTMLIDVAKTISEAQP